MYDGVAKLAWIETFCLGSGRNHFAVLEGVNQIKRNLIAIGK